MKNYLFIFVSSIFLLLLFGSCQKEHQIEQSNSQISLKDAEKIGSELFNSVNNKNEKKASSRLNHQNLSVKSTQTINSKSGKNLYYVINYAPEGFSIVSATKNYKDKILAFSPNGSFDINIARKTLGVDNWLQNVDSMINAVVDQPYNESNHFKSSTLATNAVNNVAPMLTTRWGQGVGFNNFAGIFVASGFPQDFNCTQYSNGRPPAGCVAVALGQVLNFWREPSNNTLFKWDIIDAENQTVTQGGNETSYMLAMLGGYNLGMQYACDGSGTQSSRAYDFIKTVSNSGKNYFSSTVAHVSYNVQTIVQNLNLQRPVIVHGQPSNGGAGHAWVCDGYLNDNGTTMLHFNWGWNGTSDGYYTTIPTYNSGNKIIVNIFPNP